MSDLSNSVDISMLIFIIKYYLNIALFLCDSRASSSVVVHG